MVETVMVVHGTEKISRMRFKVLLKQTLNVLKDNGTAATIAFSFGGK